MVLLEGTVYLQAIGRRTSRRESDSQFPYSAGGFVSIATG